MTLLVLTIAVLALVLGRATDMLVSFVQKKVRQVRALRRLVAAAVAWAAAERELRNNTFEPQPHRFVAPAPGDLYRFCARCQRRFTIVASLVAEVDGRPTCYGPPRDPWKDQAISVRCDATENELLAAVTAARAEGVDLPSDKPANGTYFYRISASR